MTLKIQDVSQEYTKFHLKNLIFFFLIRIFTQYQKQKLQFQQAVENET